MKIMLLMGEMKITKKNEEESTEEPKKDSMVKDTNKVIKKKL